LIGDLEHLGQLNQRITFVLLIKNGSNTL
jgi:hypothetical protein